MEKFYLEKPSIKRKEDAMDYLNEHLVLGSKINGTGGLNRCGSSFTYEQWLDDVTNLEKKEYALKNDTVPTSTYFMIRKSDNKIIGMVNIRHYLDDKLRKLAGHIGYGIRPKERGKKYSEIQLYLALLICKKLEINRVMIECSNDNIASNKTIKALGGVMEKQDYIERLGGLFNIYWIDVNDSLIKNEKIYSKKVLL